MQRGQEQVESELEFLARAPKLSEGQARAKEHRAAAADRLRACAGSANYPAAPRTASCVGSRRGSAGAPPTRRLTARRVGLTSPSRNTTKRTKKMAATPATDGLVRRKTVRSPTWVSSFAGRSLHAHQPRPRCASQGHLDSLGSHRGDHASSSQPNQRPQCLLRGAALQVETPPSQEPWSQRRSARGEHARLRRRHQSCRCGSTARPEAPPDAPAR